ncbi:hypothetical protein J2Y38_003600 [Flavobacterium sp. 2755]|uniref:DUF7619 domain-containing protein n=1 Tax=Flavobacterium sp. 2755 TaxID=2817765 RepID=UPI00285559B3|nr:T9SS type A sorting domain-containing protein [Flavobacterium sp. 2755]MDR6763379.1 hypothetical protein [Flavobacterium sp. 2755]
MKKLYFLVLALCFFNSLNAQVITIPDVVFKEILLQADTNNYVAFDINGNAIKVDSNNNLEIEVSEVQKVYKLITYRPLAEGVVRDFTGIEYFSNLKNLNCSGYYSQNLDLTVLKNLEILDCSETYQMKTLNISGLTKLKYLNVAHCINLIGLDFSGVPNLEYLNCSRLALKTIDLSPLTNLTELECTLNGFSVLDLTGLINLKKVNLLDGQLTNVILNGLSKLEFLDCGSNAITSLNLTGLTSLEKLSFESNRLKTIDLSGLTKLKTLYAGYNSLTDINVSNCANLEYLNCNNNELTSLDVSSLTKLNDLNCSDNKLVKLNFGYLPSLKKLSCNFNMLLTSLDISGLENLETLNCSNTSLAALDLIKNLHLEILTASSTKVEFLDLSPLKRLISVSLTGNNSLLYLLLKNGKTYNTYFLSAPNLKYLCVDEENIKYYQQILTQSGIQNCEINTYCNFFPGTEHYVIKGVNKYNIDDKGCEISKSLFSNVKYTVTNGNNTRNFYSKNDGSYSINVQEGAVTIKPNIENSNYFVISPSFVNVVFPAQNSPFIQDFCISPNGIHQDLEISLIPLEAARPGFDAKYKIIYKNKGTAIQSGSIDLAFDDSVLDLIISNPLISTQSNNKLLWNFSNLKPFESKEILLTLNVNSPMETPAVNNGDILKFTTAISSQETDETPLDNTFVLNQTVVGSYDPNDKTCLEGSVITPNLIGEYVHYMIRFENTGTYPAQNIVVKDLIDLSKFDISTLIPTSSSHSYVTKISEGNKVEFIFENINLPFDDANNDGYIAFKIKTKPTLQVGDSFTNEANIYFDYNFPILTNKATSTFKTLGIQDFEFSKYFTLYPNPVSNTLNVNSTQNIEIQSFEIFDILGQLVIAVPNAKSVSDIDVSRLKTGNYFIKVKSDKGSSAIKFIKK